MNPVASSKTLFCARLKYRYFLLMEAVWAGIHRKLHTVVRYLCRIHKRSTFHFVKRITFRLNIKVFELCNFCFERYGFFWSDRASSTRDMHSRCTDVSFDTKSLTAAFTSESVFASVINFASAAVSFIAAIAAENSASIFSTHLVVGDIQIIRILVVGE